MSNEKYYDDILTYLTNNGEAGVNELSRKLDIPLSSLQRYLDRQKYFKKTASRKWDIPERVQSDIKSNTLSLMVTGVENAIMLLDAQLDELKTNVANTLGPINTLKRGLESANASVAGMSCDHHPLFTKMDNQCNELMSIFKQNKNKFPEMYRDLLLNLNVHLLFLDLGREAFQTWVSGEISELIVEKTTELSDDTVELIIKYQKEE